MNSATDQHWLKLLRITKRKLWICDIEDFLNLCLLMFGQF